jgi:hypothetical protein
MILLALESSFVTMAAIRILNTWLGSRHTWQCRFSSQQWYRLGNCDAHVRMDEKVALIHGFCTKKVAVGEHCWIAIKQTGTSDYLGCLRAFVHGRCGVHGAALAVFCRFELLASFVR